MTNQNGNISIDELVSREVIYCVSGLVQTLLNASAETGSVDDISAEELYGLCQRDDWETPVEWHIQHDMSREEVKEALVAYASREDSEDDLRQMSTAALIAELCNFFKGDDSGLQDFAQERGIDPEQNEVYEHWIVTGWFAGKLEAKGEIVARDIAGLTIWGRTCTGQRVSMDGVVQEIYNEMIQA